MAARRVPAAPVIRQEGRGAPGIHLEADAPAGRVIVRAYDLTGRRRLRTEMDEADFDERTIAYFDAWLEMKNAEIRRAQVRLIG